LPTGHTQFIHRVGGSEYWRTVFDSARQFRPNHVAWLIFSKLWHIYTYIPALYSIRVSWLPLRLNNAVGWWQGKYRNKTEWKAIFKHDFTLISLHVRRRAGSYSFPSYSNSTLSLSLSISWLYTLLFSFSPVFIASLWRIDDQFQTSNNLAPSLENKQ
jgi:hypothetical protein